MRILIGTEAELLAIEDGNRAVLGDGPVSCIAVENAEWWAVAEEHRIVRAGRDDVRIRGLSARCVLPFADGALVGTSEAHLVRVTGQTSERVRSFDRVPTRDTWYTPWGGPPDTRSLTRGPDGATYAGVHVGGIIRSDDGSSWRATAIDVDADVHQVLAHPTEPGVVYAATAIGLATSRDGGASWDFTDEGLHAAYCRAVAIAGDTLVLSASRSHTGRHAALYRRPIDGTTFERCAKGLPEWFGDNVDTYCLDARSSDVVAGTTDGEVFVSTDAGESWETLLRDEPTIRCVALV